MLVKPDAPVPKTIDVTVWRKAIPQFNIHHLDDVQASIFCVSAALLMCCDPATLLCRTPFPTMLSSHQCVCIVNVLKPCLQFLFVS